MANLVGTFGAAGVSSGVPVKGGENVFVRINGTYAASVRLEKATTPQGLAWEPVSPNWTTANGTVTFMFNPSKDELVRLQAYAYTSGTVEYQITDEPAMVYHNLRDEYGQEFGVVREDGLSINQVLPVQMRALDPRQKITLYDDFLGDAVLSNWNEREGADTGTSVSGVVAGAVGGVLRLTTGDSATTTMAGNGIQVESALNWKANQGGLIFEARVALDDISTTAWFLGFTDQVAALEMPFTLGGSDALTSNATDGIGVLFDTGADADNWWIVGVKNDVDAVKENLGLAPVAATYETFRIEIDINGHATFFRNGEQIGNLMKSAVTASVALTPVFAGFSRAAAVRNLDVDYVYVQQNRIAG